MKVDEDVRGIRRSARIIFNLTTPLWQGKDTILQCPNCHCFLVPLTFHGATCKSQIYFLHVCPESYRPFTPPLILSYHLCDTPCINNDSKT